MGFLYTRFQNVLSKYPHLVLVGLVVLLCSDYTTYPRTDNDLLNVLFLVKFLSDGDKISIYLYIGLSICLSVCLSFECIFTFDFLLLCL